MTWARQKINRLLTVAAIVALAALAGRLLLPVYTTYDLEIYIPLLSIGRIH